MTSNRFSNTSSPASIGNAIFSSSSQTAFDTLDYASGKINHGSKAILMGIGEAKRELPHEFRGDASAGNYACRVYLRRLSCR